MMLEINIILEWKTICHQRYDYIVTILIIYSKSILFSPFHQAIAKLGHSVIQSILPSMHSELKGESRESAELCFLKEAQTLPEYGMVFYEVAQDKHEKIGSTWLGLSVRGIVVYSVHKAVKTPKSHWPWNEIKNLSFAVSFRALTKVIITSSDAQNKQFIIDIEGQQKSLNFYTESYKK